MTADSRKRLEQFLASAGADDLHASFAEPWLNEIIPAAREMLGCSQGTKVHLEGDVAVHTSLVFKNILSVARARLGREATFIERLSAVLHDVRKPASRRAFEDGSVDFPGHEALGAKEVPGIAKTLGLSERETTQLHFLVARHGDAHGVPVLSPQELHELTSSPWAESLALLQEADARSCILLDGGHLPIFWNELLPGNAGATQAEVRNR